MEGYAKLALLMGRHDEFAMFRRFRALNMQNLLYLQAELTELEAKHKEIVCRDAEDPNKCYYTKDWWSLSQSDGDQEGEQWEQFLDIREKLKEYNKSLSQMILLSKVEGPTPHDLEFLRSWMVRPSMGDFALVGLDRNSYSPVHELDLVAINARPSPDAFSRWFTDILVPQWHKMLGRTFKRPTSDDLGIGLYNYREPFLASILRILTTVIASLLPLCSVILQYFAQSNDLRLIFIVVASAVFAFALALMTNARKIEVFAATSA